MKRRGGGGGGTQSSTGIVSSRDGTTSNSNRQYELNLFSNEKARTIILTSCIWALILSLSLFLAIRYSSSTNCPQNHFIKSTKKNFFLWKTKIWFLLSDALCGIGQVLSRFCSDSEQIYISSPSLFW